MKLSIIVPVYNAEPYLRRCLDSLTAQTVGDYELILVNDGSTDRSGEIMAEYAGRYPALIRSVSVKNGGQGYARNIGIEMAVGEFLGFVDSDDWVSPDMYAKLCAAAEGAEADIAVCDILKCFADGSTLFHPAAMGDGPLAASGSVSNKLFRRSLVGETRFPEKMWYEDFNFSAKLLLSSRKTVFVHETLYFYRIGQPSTMHNNNASMNLDIISAAEDLDRFMRNRGIRDGMDYVLLNHILLDAVNRTAQQSCGEKRETIKKLRAYVRARLPRLTKNVEFRRQSFGRRLAMYLNYHGMEQLTRLLLYMKKTAAGD